MIRMQGARLDAIVRDDATFRAWYDQAMPRVYRYLRTRCGDDTLAEELTQQTFVTALRRPGQFDGRSDPVTWLIAIGRNQLVDHHRRHQRDERRHLRLVDEHRLGDARSFPTAGPGEAVEAALRRLPDDQRLALLFRYLDDLPVRGVAAALGRSEKATESLLGRARESFRRAYGDPADA